MKTNVPIELTDTERNFLTELIDGKQSKRMISRKEVIAICQQHIGGLLEKAQSIEPAEYRGSDYGDDDAPAPRPPDICQADPADIPLMAHPDNPSYIRGWNQVKRSA